MSRKRRKRFEVKYLPDPSNSDEFRTLDSIRKILPQGKWSHSRIFEEVDIAVDQLRIDPYQFWKLDRENQALVIARNRVHKTITAYEEYLSRPKKK